MYASMDCPNLKWPPFTEGHLQFTTVPIKPLSDDVEDIVVFKCLIFKLCKNVQLTLNQNCEKF